MRIAVASDDNRGLDGTISEHFGRCPYYTLADVNGEGIKEVRTVANPFYGSHGEQGEVPSFIHSQGVNVMITGGMGPKAIGYFNQFGIEVATGANDRVGDALNSYLSGRLSGAQPCVEGEGYLLEEKRTESDSDKVSDLKEQVATLQKQLAELEKKISELDKGL